MCVNVEWGEEEEKKKEEKKQRMVCRNKGMVSVWPCFDSQANRWLHSHPPTEANDHSIDKNRLPPEQDLIEWLVVQIRPFFFYLSWARLF